MSTNTQKQVRWYLGADTTTVLEADVFPKDATESEIAARLFKIN